MKFQNPFSKKSKSDPSEDSKAESFGKAPLGTYVLYEGKGEIVADVVFVHGLCGHALDTWSKGLVCWPRDFLKNDITKARIITWGYDSSVANASKYASKESIFGHSETLLSDIAMLRGDTALIKSAAYQNHGRHLSLGSIYHHTKGVVFLGTPHRGSDKTDLANIIASVAKFSFRQPNKQLVRALSRDSDVLENQREQFTTITRETPIICIREELPTAIGMIVPEHSASMDGFHVRKDSIPANHMDMTKFLSPQDIGYRRISSHIVTLVETSKNHEDERTRTHLLTWAGGKPLLLAAFFFYERVESSQKSREGLIRSLLHQILSQKRELIPIVFKGEIETKDIRPRRLLSWPKLKNAFEILLTHTSDSFKLCIFADGLDEYRIMDRMEDYTGDDLELFYDGENDDESVWGRSHWIANGHREVAELFKVAANTTNVKICLSSRELTPFQGAFEDYPHLRLHNLTATDITIFTKTNLYSGIKSIPTVDETDGINGLAEEIVLKAQGVFLWVRLVVDILIVGFNNGDTVPELEVTLESLPPRLGGKRGLYVEMLKNIDPEYRLQASRYIRLLLHAWNDLDLVDLEFAAEGPFEKKSNSNVNSESFPNALIAVKAPVNLVPDDQLEPRRKKMRLRLISRCGGLLEAPDKYVLFMHQTVKEFFLREELWIHLHPQEFQSSFDPSLALLSACILRLKCLEELISQSDGRYFSLDYIYVTDSMHYAASSEGHGANKEAYFCLLDELDLTCTQLARALFLRYEIQDDLIKGGHWSGLEPVESGGRIVSKHDSFLSFAIQAGLTSYVESKLSSGNIPVGAKFGKPLLAYAVSLLDGATPRLIYARGDNHAGIGYNFPDISIVRLLLSLGADTSEKYDGTSVWKEAVSTADDIFAPHRTLFARGVASTGLVAQNQRRWIEIMKMMLRHGANQEDFCLTKGHAHSHLGVYYSVPAREVIRYILGREPEYSKDLEELEEIFKESVSTV
ncbi:hypothetical protein VE02_04446 [Pseudogymnoascus sp. 03VT05]|nr:hypothetical protein VE02_04446 [Pseudogymnoascus sp. 03VT05]